MAMYGFTHYTDFLQIPCGIHEKGLKSLNPPAQEPSFAIWELIQFPPFPSLKCKTASASLKAILCFLALRWGSVKLKTIRL